MINSAYFPLNVLVVVAYYLPVSVAGYAIYGDELDPNILETLSPSTITTIVKVMISLHLLMGAIIVINPFCQELEELLKAPLSEYISAHAPGAFV